MNENQFHTCYQMECKECKLNFFPTDINAVCYCYSLLLSQPRVITQHGYPLEEHFVTTTDDYILALHRIPRDRGPPTSSSRKPVLLMHGLTMASPAFVAIGPHYSLGMALITANIIYTVTHIPLPSSLIPPSPLLL